MSKVDYTKWVDVIRGKSERFGVIFLQIGYSNEPARRALLASDLTLISVHEYMESDDRRSSGTLLINEVESFANLPPKAQETRMGNLRARVLREVEEGARMILLSRAPRIAFPPTVGSSLLDDASFAHAPVVNVTGPDQMPSCLEDGTDPIEVLNRAVMELGPEVCASLDRVLYENQLVGDDALSLLNARELEALDGAGITAPHKSQRSWNFGRHLVPLKGALDHACANVLEPQQQLAEVNASLWKIERIIRREVRQKAINTWGKSWRTQCLNEDLRGKVLQRATESAYLGANSVKQLRDPLEWLSLGELLSLKDQDVIGNLGLAPALWNQFRVQVMPIRNRLAHMRTIQSGDTAEVIKWRRLLENNLGTPPSPS